MAKQNTLIHDDAPPQPIDDPPAEIPGEPQPSPPHEPVPTPAPPPPSPPPVRGFLMPDGLSIEVASANVRPPGPIADQSTSATGIWARVTGEPWFKTRSHESEVWRKTRRAKTAAEALRMLIGG